MRRLLLGCAALTFAGFAFGADLPVKAPPASVSYFSWTSCYVGATPDTGGAARRFSGRILAPTSSEGVRDDISGPLVGGQVGCNYQLSGNWVVGVEGSLSWGRIDRK